MARLAVMQGVTRSLNPETNGNIIPQGRKARITHWNGKVSLISGPARRPLFSKVEIFNQFIVPEGEQGYIVDENGAYAEVIGPQVIDIHPDGAYKPHTRHELANYEAMVVIEEDGEVTIYKGDANPTVWVKDRQRVHSFHWTGSDGETEEKTPGALDIDILRLQDTQTYYSLQVRTKDNIVNTLRLMVYYSYGEVSKLMENNDPLGAMYNQIMATLVGYVAGLAFDDFKTNTNEKIASHEIFTTNKAVFSEYGIEIKEVVVRAWEPVDREVQRILEKAATIQTQKSLDEAEHERRMAQLDHQGLELDKSQELDSKKAEAAAAEGEREAQRLTTLYATLAKRVDEKTARQLLLLNQAGKAQALYLSPAMLDGQ